MRMEIMELLRDGQLSVGDIASAINHSQTAISRNLAALRSVGVVVAQREGNRILYHIANPKLVHVCDLMREVLTEQIDEKSRMTKDGVLTLTHTKGKE